MNNLDEIDRRNHDDNHETARFEAGPSSHSRETTTSSTNTTTTTMTNQNHTTDGPVLRESWIEDEADASFDVDLAGPSTPNRSRNSGRFGGEVVVTENWDDDFEDGTDSPRQPHYSGARVPPTPASMRGPTRTTSNASRIENWDDEFGSTQTSPASRRGGVRRNHYSSDDDGDGEFGFDDREEEDKTVTARSRGSTVGEESQRPPPLPVFIPPTNATTIQPFPRSPTASVFSVPHTTSARNSIAGYSTNSMTHLALHPTTSRASSLSARGFAGLPPSPPLHKTNRDRERRRLKKKSRPPGVGEGMYEMREVEVPEDEMDSYPPPFHLPEETYRELTPPRSPPRGSISLPREDFLLPPNTATPEKPASTPSPPSTSPPTKTPLLQRIGSVKKKFGVRRKRASTTPSEVALHEASHHDDLESTPRPTSSMSSTYQSSPTKQPSGLPSSGASSSSWFFRSGGGGSSSQLQSQPPPRPKMTSQSRSSSGFSSTSTGLISGLRHQPSLERQLLQQTNGESPSKLVKRKSFGFVQIRKGIRPETGYDHDERERGGDVLDLKAGGKYGSLARARTPSHSSSSNANYGADPSEEHLPAVPNPVTPVPSGSRGFMGSVRRISMGERRSSAASHTHKRTKSSVSATDRSRALGPELTRTRSKPRSRDPSVEGRRSISGNAPSIRSSKGKEPASRRSSVESKRGDAQAGLLPPIQLQTPASTLGRGTNRVPSRSGAPSGVIPALPPLPSSLPGKGVQAASLGRSAIAPNLSAAPGSNSALASAAAGRDTGSAMRRNSLGDLKIPARITQAQSGLRRDLMMVKEFAANVGQLKDLQRDYARLVNQVNSVLDSHHQAAQAAQAQVQPPAVAAQATPRSISPNIFRRHRSNTNPQVPTSPPPSDLHAQQAYKQLVSAFYSINSKYRVSWECAELLIELGGGAVPEPPSSAPAGPSTSQSEPLMTSQVHYAPSSGPESEWKKLGIHHGRERAVTLSGEDTSRPVTPLSLTSPTTTSSNGPPPAGANPTAQWRASTGRNDLSQRQLLLLKEMLNSPNLSPDLANTTSSRQWDNSFEEGIPEEGRTPPPSSSPGGHGSMVNRDWRWGDAMNSTLTLPSEENERHFSSNKYDQHLRPAYTPSGGSLWMSKEDVSGGTSPQKKRRSSRLGMSGIRDMLRAIKKGANWDTSSSSPRGYEGSASNSSRATPPPLPPNPQPISGLPYLPSTTSLSTESSNSHHNALHHLPKPPAPQSGRRRAKTSTEPQPESFKASKRPNSPYHSTSLSSMKASPRRPSLASIFKIGKSNKTLSSQKNRADNGGDTSSDSVGESLSPGESRRAFRTSGSTGEEDWDKLELPVDYEAKGISKDGTATIRGLSGPGRGRSPYMQPNHPSDNPRRSTSRVASASQSSVAIAPLPTTPRRASASQSQTSLHERLPVRPSSSGGPSSSFHHHRLPRLSNVDEHGDQPSRPKNIRSSSRQSSGQSQGQQGSPRVASGRLDGLPSMKSGSVRSMPQGLVISDSSSSQQQYTLQHQSSSRALALAMTPENIKPLLENAREVHVKLMECINEIQTLLDFAKQSQLRGESAPTNPGLLSPPLTVASAGS